MAIAATNQGLNNPIERLVFTVEQFLRRSLVVIEYCVSVFEIDTTGVIEKASRRLRKDRPNGRALRFGG